MYKVSLKLTTIIIPPPAPPAHPRDPHAAARLRPETEGRAPRGGGRAGGGVGRNGERERSAGPPARPGPPPG